ncbi:MAG: DUF2288 domain-containing protein [Chloroflexi bacterium]|nr:DUF2288 domain-containing protein [Chloroflexota bacterium]
MSEIVESFQQALAEVGWKDLRIHMQRDAIILVDAALDLIDTAVAVATDDKGRVDGWIAAGQLVKPTAEQIAAWETTLDKPFRMLIVQPFILAQMVENA